MKPKVNRNKAMLVGVLAAIAAMMANRWLGLDASPNNSVAYWFGVILAGALVGLAVAAIINRSRA